MKSMMKWNNISLEEVYPYPLESFDILPIIAKIVAVVVYIISGIGYLLILGIAHYEKYGQDPQKRPFQDKLIGFVCWNYVLTNFISHTLITIRWLYGPIGHTATIITYSLTSLQLNMPMALAEGVIFRCLLIFHWKKFASIDDDFFAKFFYMFNFIIIGFGLTIIRLMEGEFEHRYDYGTISGNEIFDIDDFM